MHLHIKRWAVAPLALLIVTFAPGCRKPQRFQYVQVLMGVENRMVLYAKDESTARPAAKAAFERVAQLEDIMSDYQSGSELMRLCAGAGSGPVPISKELYEVLAYAQEVSAASDGAFDVTVGPYVRLWRTARKTNTLPTPTELADARRRVGWTLLKLDKSRQTAELTVPGMQLDLGGIAKGYAGDEVIRILREHGIASGLYEAGGDIVVSDAPPKTRGWGIEVPPRKKILTLCNTAISTSGETFQFVDIGGVRYSHVIDPRTGMALSKHVMATVIAPRGITTDSLSTAATVLGEPAASSLFRRFHAYGFIHRASSTTSETNP